MVNITIFILVRIECWWLVSLNEIIVFFIFLFESIVFVYICKRYFDACAHITCSLCNHTNWNVNSRKYIVLSFFSLHFKIWIDTESVRMFSFSMESRYCLKWTLFFICCSLFNFIMWWFYLVSLCGGFVWFHYVVVLSNFIIW